MTNWLTLKEERVYSVLFLFAHSAFLWDANLKHPKARLSNNGYTISIGENCTWVSVGTNTVLSHGVHYWEVVLDRYGTPSLSRKVVIGVASGSYHHWHRSDPWIDISVNIYLCPNVRLMCITKQTNH